MKKVEILLSRITKKLETKPSPELYATRAHIYSEKLKRSDLALEDLNKACEFPFEKGKRGAQIPFHNRARLFKNHFKDFEKAIKDYSTSIEIYPNSLSLAARGTLYASESFSDYDSAVKDYTRAIELKPEHAPTYKHRGTIYLENLKDYEKAISDFNFVLSKNPKDHVTMKNKGISLRQGFSDRSDEAFKCFTDATKISRYDFQAYFYRAELLEKHYEKYDLALKDYDTSLTINPGFVECYIHRGNLLQSKYKDYTSAIQDYLQAIESSSSNDNKWVKLAIEKKNRLLRKINRMKKGKSESCSNCGTQLKLPKKEKLGPSRKETEKNYKRIICVVCKMAVYCSQECKKEDWKSHKMNCRSWREKCNKRKNKNSIIIGGGESTISDSKNNNKQVPKKRIRRRRKRNKYVK